MLDLETIGYFLYMESKEKQAGNHRSRDLPCPQEEKRPDQKEDDKNKNSFPEI